MKFNTESKQFKLYQTLSAGEQLTEAQIASRFGLRNPRAAVSSLRMNHGVAVYANEKVDTKGRRTLKYRIGAPSRKVVAAGYRALAAGMTI